MSNKVKHQPPHADYKINEMINLGLFDEAEAAVDENIEFYRAKEDAQQENWRRIAMARVRSAHTGEHAQLLGELLDEEEGITPPSNDDSSLPAFLRRQAD